MNRNQPHNDLVNVCLSWLAIAKIPAWQNNSGAYKRGKSYIRYGFPGSPDILGCLPPNGRILGVECKTGAGKPTDEQVEFLRTINDAGGLGIVVYTLDELQAALDERKD